ncbi:MAG: hypothetical protein ACTTJX_04565 [Fusobacterium sp.]
MEEFLLEMKKLIKGLREENFTDEQVTEIVKEFIKVRADHLPRFYVI